MPRTYEGGSTSYCGKSGVRNENAVLIFFSLFQSKKRTLKPKVEEALIAS